MWHRIPKNKYNKKKGKKKKNIERKPIIENPTTQKSYNVLIIQSRCSNGLSFSPH